MFTYFPFMWLVKNFVNWYEKNNSGRQARKAGQLRPGYDADLIAISKNPLEDIGVLVRPDNITHVWKGGVLYKSPRV